MKRQKRTTKRQRRVDAIARRMELALAPPEKPATFDALVDRVYRYTSMQTGRFSSVGINLRNPSGTTPRQAGAPGLLAVDYETLERRVFDYAVDDATYAARIFKNI